MMITKTVMVTILRYKNMTICRVKFTNPKTTQDYNDDFEDFDEAPPKKQPDPTSSKKPVVSHAPVYAVPPPVFDLAINGTAPVQAKPSFTTPPSKQEYVKLESNLPERKMIDLETSRKQNQKAKTMHASEIKRLVRAKVFLKRSRNCPCNQSCIKNIHFFLYRI